MTTGGRSVGRSAVVGRSDGPEVYESGGHSQNDGVSVSSDGVSAVVTLYSIYWSRNLRYDVSVRSNHSTARVDDERVDELTTRTHVNAGTCACLDVDVCGSARIANRAYRRARRGIR